MDANLNKIIAELFEEIADMLELLDENPFKISAFRNSARLILNLSSPVDELIKSGEIKNIKGLGKASIEKASEYIQSGSIHYHQELFNSIPNGLFEILKIKGLGPKKVTRLWKELNITSLGELEYACKENRLVLLNGFGDKTQKNVLENNAFLKLNFGKYLSDKIFIVHDQFTDYLKNDSYFTLYSPIGKIRRAAESYESIDYLIAAESPKNAITHLNDFFSGINQIDSTKYMAKTESGIPFNIMFCKTEEFPFNQFFYTGDELFLQNFSESVKKQKIIITNNEFIKDGKKIKIIDENDIFKYSGIQFIRPGLRDNVHSIDAAIQHQIPDELVTKDIIGALHIHTTFSDGQDSPESMINAAKECGFKYIGFCDHSQSAFYANGLTIERVLQQFKIIDELQTRFPDIKILKGIESDILKDGSLDYPGDILKQFDFIVASIHSNFNLSYEDMTERLVKAASNKYTTIIGHPSGRLLLSRESYKFDWDKLISACTKNNVALELNSDEHRLDTPYEIIEKAFAKKVKICINSDAHQSASLKNIRNGVRLINKTLIKKEDVLNTFLYKEFLEKIKKVK